MERGDGKKELFCPVFPAEHPITFHRVGKDDKRIAIVFQPLEQMFLGINGRGKKQLLLLILPRSAVMQTSEFRI